LRSAVTENEVKPKQKIRDNRNEKKTASTDQKSDNIYKICETRLLAQYVYGKEIRKEMF